MSRTNHSILDQSHFGPVHHGKPQLNDKYYDSLNIPHCNYCIAVSQLHRVTLKNVFSEGQIIMRNRVLLPCAAAFLALVAPSMVQAGTRAAATAVAVSTKEAKPTVGPKNGFPAAPGLDIARLKANPNAAFNRAKSNGT